MKGFLIRVSAFLLKEILETTRQPLLLLTLVIGPFLILLFFGLGYRNEARALRTLFVVDDDSPIAAKLDEYASTLGPQLIFSGRTNDLEEAQLRLRRGDVDLVTVLPSNPYETILGNNQAVFELYHNEIDPFQTDYISVFGRVYVNEVNRRVLRLLTSEGQLDISKVQEKLDEVRASTTKLRELLQECAEALAQAGRSGSCDGQAIIDYVDELRQKVEELDAVTEEDLTVSDVLEQELSGQPLDRPFSEALDHDEDALTLERIIDRTDLLEAKAQTVDDYIRQLETLTQLETDLDSVEVRLKQFLQIKPNILISPFRSEVTSIATVPLKVNDFFAPAVIVLLLQHLILTFAALSMVRERQLGSVELFHVAPLSPLETLIGKYISYLLFGGSLAAILLTLISLGLDVPMLGHWLNVGLVVLAVLFASLGIGFVISVISKTDTQAVQYAMIVLLTSVFFSGFLLGLNTLWLPVQTISYSLPATYGILLLRDIMLRGLPLDWNIFIPLVSMGLILFLVAWLLLERSMNRI
ncbi:MAG TPA: ABC transporter permease [Anaerolineae bacterium]|nr:ABC transporter permease [Anaerolineae bacterium]